MRSHAAIGGELVARIDAFAHLAPAVRASHERWDGGGYPDGLAGETIPLAARIIAACDTYDAIVPTGRTVPRARRARRARSCAGLRERSSTRPSSSVAGSARRGVEQLRRRALAERCMRGGRLAQARAAPGAQRRGDMPPVARGRCPGSTSAASARSA